MLIHGRSNFSATFVIFEHEQTLVDMRAAFVYMWDPYLRP